MKLILNVLIYSGIIFAATDGIPPTFHDMNSMTSSLLQKYTPGGHEDLEPPRDYRLPATDFEQDNNIILSNYGESSQTELLEISPQQSVQNIQQMRGGAAAIVLSTESADEDEKTSTASVQYMITNRMKKVLQDDLGYLEHEVDIMAPEIAAVVIDRGLNRPSNGMPSSWRRKDQTGVKVLAIAKRTMSETSLRLNETKQIFSSLLTKNRKNILPVVSILAMIIFRTDLFKGGVLGFRIFERVLGKILNVINFPVNSFKAFQRRRAPAKLDFRSLEALRRPSWVDAVQLKVLDARTKTHSV